MTRTTAIYIHWPFCASKCPYCDFNAHVRERIDEDSWKNAYLAALSHYAEMLPERIISSVFFGGGTPSLMPPATVQAIVDSIQKHWRITNDIEITLEANPTSVEREKFLAFKEAGINKVSLGIQSLNDDDLQFLGRKHSVRDALTAIETAANVFERASFDLIYARPNQTLKNWQEELEKALDYTARHLSLYQLTVERNTPFHVDHAQGKFSMPDEELAADFYILTQEIMTSRGLPAYEVSNHAAPGEESRHNMAYWTGGDYIGIGPGAHGRITLDSTKYATRDHAAPEIWLERVQTSGYGRTLLDPLSPEDRFLEGFMTGLRLRKGISLSELERRSGADWAALLDQDKINIAQKEGWAERSENTLRLTTEGILRMNALIPYLLRDDRSDRDGPHTAA
ncbi:MAG: radical SAM family heme chaperone HemW [Alphaproteobacteria bacterium]|nr:radical SAM family heme chaperone HemW [Alphaproteobacteria bacterium]